MRKLIRIASISIITSLLITLGGGLNLTPTTVGAVGDLTVDWGVTSGNPIFIVTNMTPGETVEREVDVTNLSSSQRFVGVKGVKTSETAALSQALDITISEGASILYGPTSVAEFFTDSNSPAGVPLSNLNGSDSTSYKFSVNFNQNSGNQYQNAQLVFDLIIGVTIELPSECNSLDLISTPIIGTAATNRLRGTAANELIMGLEGADRIEGGGGNDCIIGGPGADRIEGGSGNDVIFGDEGADTIASGTGNDLIFGGIGSDKIEGDSDNDTIYGGDAADDLKGGSGDDIIHGDDSADKIDGGSDNDQLFGDDGTDKITGGSGNDSLIGGTGPQDNANGNAGIDTCDAEVETSCEN